MQVSSPMSGVEQEVKSITVFDEEIESESDIQRLVEIIRKSLNSDGERIGVSAKVVTE